MIDIILFAAFAATFSGGFWCGKKYGSMKATWAAFLTLFN